jgi:hypothetical protein
MNKKLFVGLLENYVTSKIENTFLNFLNKIKALISKFNKLNIL